jgi:hypothetical protein
VIVVAGNLRTAGTAGVTAAAIAERVAASGARVEVVGIVDAVAIGDRALIALRAAGVGHAAVLRSTATGLEPADLDLALRYLPDVAAIVMVEPAAELQAAASVAAAFSAAGLIVVSAPGGAATEDVPTARAESSADRAIVLSAPARDPDGAFAGVVAALAVRLADGATPADAWNATVAALGVEPVSPPSAA